MCVPHLDRAVNFNMVLTMIYIVTLYMCDEGESGITTLMKNELA